MKRGIGFLICLALLGVLAVPSSMAEGKSFFSERWLDQAGKPVSVYDDLVKIKMSGEFRYRFEFRDNFNFSRKFEDDAINLFRSRFGLDFEVSSSLRIFAQIQDSESLASQSAHRSSAFVNRLDLHQLFVEAKNLFNRVPVTIKAGRQELSYGDQRFVGAFDWSNVARVFDAAKVIFKPSEKLQLDAWYSQAVPVNKGQADSADHSNHFWGFYGASKPIPDHDFDTFLFIRHDEDNEIKGERSFERGQLKEYTAGNRFKGKKANFDYGIEWAYQFGSRAHELIQAWAWHNELGYTFALLPWKPRLDFEYNHGSGDKKANDGRVKNFDNLFPTNHIYYGYMDFASLRNIEHFKFGLSFKPVSSLKLAADYHFLLLDTNKSPWFNASQGIIRSPTPNASTDIGRELDLTLWYQIAKHVKLLIGYGYFRSGPFVKDTGEAANANFFYIQPIITF